MNLQFCRFMPSSFGLIKCPIFPKFLNRLWAQGKSNMANTTESASAASATASATTASTTASAGHPFVVKGGRKPPVPTTEWKEVETLFAGSKLSLDNFLNHEFETEVYDLRFGKNNWKSSVVPCYDGGFRQLELRIYERRVRFT